MNKTADIEYSAVSAVIIDKEKQTKERVYVK